MARMHVYSLYKEYVWVESKYTYEKGKVILNMYAFVYSVAEASKCVRRWKKKRIAVEKYKYLLRANI